VAQEIRELSSQRPDLAWLRWLQYAVPYRHAHRYDNYGQVAATALMVLKECCPPSPAPPGVGRSSQGQRIRWNKADRTLWIDGEAARTYGRHAPKQFAVLDAFEAAGWPLSIPKPLKYSSLKDAIDELNHGLASSKFRFYRRDDGSVEWGFTPV
jgi:hypothetical protein